MLKPRHPRSASWCVALVAGVVVMGGVGESLALGQSAAAWQCPDGGVLDDQRAYFGSTLSTNVCSTPGAVCEQVFFFSQQRQTDAVCSSGRWLPQGEPSSASDACPQFVFAGGEVWSGGSYAANSCDTATAPTCERAYFYRLPEGGSGYRNATCVDGEWRPGPEVDPTKPGEDEAFRLRRARTGSELESYLKRGLKATYGGGSPWLYGPPGPGGGVISPPIDGPTDDVALSETNVQEAGVDEEDRVKSDGRHLYVLKNHQSLRASAPPSQGNEIRILEIAPSSPSATAISELAITLPDGQQASGIYLRAEADQLVMTASNLDRGWSFWYSPLAWLDAQSTVASIDVAVPAQPRQGTTLELDGELISSRRIGDILLLATRFHPRIPGLEVYQPDAPGSQLQIARIEAASLSDLLPKLRSSAESEARPLVNPWDCYLPAQAPLLPSADLITLVAVDLDTMGIVSSKCFVGATETLYVSLESIYVASTRYDYSLEWGADGAPWIDYRQPKVETDLHKFSLDGGLISYQASGVVDGHLGWNILRRPFRLSERGLDLRVITYTDELTEDQSPVAVTVLRDAGSDELEVFSRLPNEQRPDSIGKPGEQLYASRFVGDRAYLVTFLMTDPLYVIDLSRPEDPFVAGELEITGYSDYLHPLDNGYLLGIGKDAIPDPQADFRGAWYQGIKVSLYNASDPARVFEADALILGKRGSEAPVLYDHRAFTFLAPKGGNPRVAIGAAVHDRPNQQGPPQPWSYFDWSYSGLHLFEIDTAAGRILGPSVVPVEQYQPSPDGHSGVWPTRGDDRSVLAGDAVFYVIGDDVYAGFWNNPASFIGPR